MSQLHKKASLWLFPNLITGLLSGLLLLLVSCGFHLREVTPIPFKSIRVLGSTQISEPLKTLISQQGITVVNDSALPAELELELIREESEKRILSLSGQGVVREFELYYRVQYRTRVAGRPSWEAPLIMESRRDYTYSDANFLAKQAEEKRLNQGMQFEVMQGIMRRLAVLKK
jgi:LPS-assembly lipoprotein